VNRGLLIEDIVAISRIAAPTFAEGDRISWLESRLARAGGRRVRDGTGNLLWTWGEGQPRLMLTAHVDTVFPAGTRLTVRRRNGLLIGPGVGDNAAAVAVAIGVVEQLLNSRALAGGAVAFTVCEEGLGNLRGAAAACAALRPRRVVALEGHMLDEVIVQAVGSARARVRVEGPGGHPWNDRGRPSAVHALLRIGDRLADRSSAHAPVNVGLVAGGGSINTLADHAELLVEVRSTKQERLDAFVTMLDRLTVPAPLSVVTEVLGRRPAGRLRPDAQLLRAVREIRAELELPDSLTAASTDANAALAQGIPALTLGVARGAEMHSTRERIRIDSLALGWRQLEELLLRLLGSG
jgi:tripeptide aminopeptidase